jgi:hypothetical protein
MQYDLGNQRLRGPEPASYLLLYEAGIRLTVGFQEKFKDSFRLSSVSAEFAISARREISSSSLF